MRKTTVSMNQSTHILDIAPVQNMSEISVKYSVPMCVMVCIRVCRGTCICSVDTVVARLIRPY